MYRKSFDHHEDGHPEHLKQSIVLKEQVEIQVEDDRTGMTVETLRRALADNLYYIQGKDEYFATPHDYLHGSGSYRARPAAPPPD